MARAHTATSKELVEGRRWLDAWRQTRKTRAMPEDLWAVAARLRVRPKVALGSLGRNSGVAAWAWLKGGSRA